MAKKKPIVSKYGQWKYPGQETIIPDANGRITMQGVPYPVFGIDDQGNQQMMMPGQEYKFPGNSVYEIPLTDKNIMARGFDRGSGKSTGVAQPKELTKEQRALDDWQRLTSNGSSTFEKRIPAPDDKTYQQLLSRSQGGPSSSDKGIFLGAYKQVGGQLVPHDISVPNLSRQDGGDMPFGLPLKEQNIYTLPEYNQPRNPKTGEILPDPRRPNLGMGTGATEYKMTYGVDEGDVDVPSIVAGQYIGDQAYDRYNLTGERFKTMTDPGSYSNFYEQIGRLGLMQEKNGGSVKRVRIKSLPNNWKTQ